MKVPRCWRAIIFAAGLLPPAALAQSQPNSYDRTVEGWHVFGGRTDAGAVLCIMSSAFQSGTTLAVGTRGDQPSEYFFSLRNPAWRSLDPGNPIDLTVRFNDLPTWTVHGTTVEVSDQGHGFIFGTHFDPDTAHNVLVDFMISRSMTIEHDGHRVDGFNLDGTRAAVLALINCRVSVGNGPNYDPFVRN